MLEGQSLSDTSRQKGGGRESWSELSTNQTKQSVTVIAMKVAFSHHSMVAAQWARLSQPVADTLPNTALRIYDEE